MPRKFGLIGYPLAHSFSKSYFESKFQAEKLDCSYQNLEVEKLNNIRAYLIDNQFEGVNITIPHKQNVLKYLDEISPEAKQIGAVNAIKIRNQRLFGYNTDVFGFKKSLLPLISNKENINALILGNGGAALAVKHVLNELKIPFKTVSRTENSSDFTFEKITSNVLKTNKLIINCTPLGTFPNINSKAELPYQNIYSDHILFDLVYNPEVTAFLNMGISKGAITKNGYEMLILQAEKAWEIWNN